jgi:hypothetical protein
MLLQNKFHHHPSAAVRSAVTERHHGEPHVFLDGVRHLFVLRDRTPNSLNRTTGRLWRPNPHRACTNLCARTLRPGATSIIMRFLCPQTWGRYGYTNMMAAIAKVPEDSETTRLIEQAARGDQEGAKPRSTTALRIQDSAKTHRR